MASTPEAQSPSLSEPIPEMTEAYHKARRQFALFSGILMAWEYVGIKDNADVKGQIGQVLRSLRNPEVLPIVILFLVLYFAYRYTVEWNQCHPLRRDLPASKIDRSVSYGLGGFAILVFLLQKIFPGLRLANLLTPQAAGLMLIGLAIPWVAPVSLMSLIRSSPRRIKEWILGEHLVPTYKRFAVISSIGVIFVSLMVIQSPRVLKTLFKFSEFQTLWLPIDLVIPFLYGLGQVWHGSLELPETRKSFFCPLFEVIFGEADKEKTAEA